jgi:hypothetical protein
MAGFSKTLVSNANATGPAKAWPGGRAILVIMATTFPTTTELQLLGQDGATWITLVTPTVNGITALDAPAGSYRIKMTGGAPVAVYADLVHVPYN